jgi:phosphotransferase system HPr (HPr) family protein
MVERIAHIKAQFGLHARPSGAIRNAAAKYSDTRIILVDPMHKHEDADAKSILQVMTLGKKCGDELIVRAYGRDEEKAAEDVARVINEYEIEE